MHRRTLVALPLALFLSVSCKKEDANAPFEGEVTMHTVTGTSAADMTVRIKGDALRFDMKNAQGEPTHGLFDPRAGKVTFFLDAQKSYMDMDFGKPSAQSNTDPGTGSVAKAGADVVAGRGCESYRVTDPSGKKSEVCVTSGLAFFDLSSLRPGGSKGDSALAKEFQEKKSFPLRAIEYDASGKELSKMVVTKIERKSLDAKLFDVPKDYKKLEPSKG